MCLFRSGLSPPLPSQYFHHHTVLENARGHHHLDVITGSQLSLCQKPSSKNKPLILGFATGHKGAVISSCSATRQVLTL